jgi:predicted acyltransferase (DUF342 family)
MEAETAEVSEKADIGAKVLTQKGFKAAKLELGRHASVEGPIVGKDVEIGPHSRVEDVWADKLQIERGVRVRNIYATKVTAERGLRVDGEILYVDRADLDEHSKLAQEPRRVTQLPPPPL